VTTLILKVQESVRRYYARIVEETWTRALVEANFVFEDMRGAGEFEAEDFV
jgi:hypothetical protein